MKKFYSILVLSLLALLGMSSRAATVNFTLDVDHADRIVAQTVEMMHGIIELPKTIELQDGVNTVTATCENVFTILSNGEEYEITSVTVNGVEENITDSHKVVFFVPSDFGGSTVVVRTAEAGTGGGEVDPEPPVVEKCAVSFEFADDNARNYVDFVVANDMPVDNWEAGFEVDPGTYIAVNINSSVQNVKIYANDVEQSYNTSLGNYQFQINEPTVVRAESFVPEPDPTYTINVDNASAVEVGYEIVYFWSTQKRYLSLTNGENVFTLDGTYSSIFVNAKTGFNLESVKVNGTEVTALDNIAVSRDMVIDITTSEVVVEKAHLTLKCDDYTRVSVSMGMTTYELTSNEQQLEFIPGEDAVFAISAADASQPLYSVKHNGNEVYGSGFGSSSKTYYIYNPQDGDLIEVQAIAPEVTKYPVSFLFNNDTARSYITEVAVDNVLIDNWADGFEAEELAYVAVGVDMSMSNVTIKVNGVQKTPNALFRNISFNVYEATVVEVTAEVQTDPEPVAITINVNVDDATRVKVGHVAEEGDNDLTVVDGDNIITLPAGVNEIYVRPATNEATIKSVTVNDVEVADGGYENIPVADGDHIVVLSDRTDAIRAIMGGADSVEVYSINGVKVMSNADVQQVRNLAPGMYIINGKKVIKK